MVMDKVEKMLGLPKLSELTKTMEKFPDEKQLKAIKQVLTIAERVSKSALELDQVVMLIREINAMPLDKLEKLEKLLKRIEKIMKHTPDELMNFLISLKEE
ncbi:hypothetical protein ES703_00354 [subsurface metagenome]